MRTKNSRTIFGALLKKIAPRIGASVIVEPRWKAAGQITFRNGKRRYLRYSSLDLNPLAASLIATDKDYANFFLKRMGYPVPRGEAFFSDTWAKTIGSRRTAEAAIRFAEKLGFPIIIKPNSQCQGKGVSLANTGQECSVALKRIFTYDNVALVQERVVGKDFRIVVLDDEVLSVYERTPLSLTGDGHSTIFSLFKKKQRNFRISGRDTALDVHDPRIRAKLSRQGLSMRSVPSKGTRVFLLDNANLSTGGDAAEVKKVHSDVKKLAAKIARDMGLRFCGIDIIVEDGLEQPLRKYWILEVNAAPGLDHYARSGQVQEKTVEAMYLKVLKSLEE